MEDAYGRRVRSRSRHLAFYVLACLSLALSGSILAQTAAPLVPTTPKPPPAPSRWLSLIGEYGKPDDKAYVLENNQRLVFRVHDQEQTFTPGGRGNAFVLNGEPAHFVKAANGDVRELQVASKSYPRLPFSAVTGGVFHITHLKPVAELTQAALRDHPPQEHGDFLPADLVDVTTVDSLVKLDVRYASTNNFLGTAVYQQARAFLQRPAADAVARADKRLRPLGYGLLIHDAYRPWYVTKVFWDATPEPLRKFVADPSQGSRHNRGCAVDITLFDLKTGKEIPMTGVYDEMSDRSYPNYPGGTSLQRWHRDLLRQAMEDEGFKVFEFEWWHFDYKDWQRYPIENVTFNAISPASKTAAAR